MFVAACALSVLLALVPLAFVLFFVISQGVQALNLDFFTHMPRPVGEPGGGMANAIVGTLMLTGLAAIRRADRRHERHLPVGVSRHAVRVGGAVRRRHAERRPVDRHRRLRLRDRRAALQAVQRARRRPGARHHDDPDHRPHDRRAAAAGAEHCAGRGAGARRDTRASGLHRHRAGGAAGHHHRHRARAGPHRGRDGAAAVHGVQQPVFHDQPDAADLVDHGAGLHLRHLAVRRLAPAGVGRRARPRHDRAALLGAAPGLRQRRVQRMRGYNSSDERLLPTPCAAHRRAYPGRASAHLGAHARSRTKHVKIDVESCRSTTARSARSKTSPCRRARASSRPSSGPSGCGKSTFSGRSTA